MAATGELQSLLVVETSLGAEHRDINTMCSKYGPFSKTLPVKSNAFLGSACAAAH